MRTRLFTRFVLFAIGASVLTTARPASAQDCLLTVSGTFLRSDFSGYKILNGDFTDLTTPLLDLDRLQGGTFEASFHFAQRTPPTSGNGTNYSFGTAYGLNFALFDSHGAVVHRGLLPQFSSITVLDNFGPPFVDQLTFASYPGQVTSLITPGTLLTDTQETFPGRTSIDFVGAVSGGANYLTGLGIPLGQSVYNSFPNGSFSTSIEWQDGDGMNLADPSQYLFTQVDYRITRVSIAAPEPGTIALMAVGILSGIPALRRRRRAA